MNTFTPGVGGVISADIAVPQHDQMVQFYSRILTTGQNPLWRKDLMNNLGMPVIGLGKQSGEYADLPLQWMPHIQVSDVARSAQCALDMGGTEILHGRDDNGMSQWAVFLDPNGSAFGIIPVISAQDIPSTDEPMNEGTTTGCIAWLDLTVNNAQQICQFYQSVIGWTVSETNDQNASDYGVNFNLIGDAGTADAGIKHESGDTPDNSPVWMLYLPVGDIVESLRLVKKEGGKVIKEIMGPEKTHKYAVIQDPVAVNLALIPD